MKCSQVRELWPTLLDARAAESERAAVDEHLRGCASCERERQSLLMAENLLQRYGKLRRVPPAGLVDRVMIRLDAAARPTLVRELVRLAAAEGILLALSAFAVGRVSVDPVVEKVGERAHQTTQYVTRELPQIIAASLSEAWRSTHDKP